jgi:hypothetical protein
VSWPPESNILIDAWKQGDKNPQHLQEKKFYLRLRDMIFVERLPNATPRPQQSQTTCCNA